MHDINITLVNYQAKDDLLEAVASVMNDVVASPYSARVTVVDNSNNRDGLKESLAESHPAVVYADPAENIGFGRGTTFGFQQAPARYYFALNPDTRLLPGSKTIRKLIEFMDAHPRVGCIGPKLVYMDDTPQASCYRFQVSAIAAKPFKHIDLDKRYRRVRKYTDRLLMTDFDRNRTRPVDWVLGAAMVVRKEVTDAIGWFDPRYFMYMEDCDWCRTMWERGWPVYYVHDIVIQHRYARDSAKVPGVVPALWQNPLARAHLKSWLQYMWKWRGKNKYFATR